MLFYFSVYMFSIWSYSLRIFVWYNDEEEIVFVFLLWFYMYEMILDNNNKNGLCVIIGRSKLLFFVINL